MKILVNGQTRLYGILGYPVGHSLSPVFQNAALVQKRKNAIYVPLSIPPRHVRDFLRVLPGTNFSGVNVTVPYKEIAFCACKKTTPVAKKLKAVNVIRVEPGGIVGHNTDGKGFTDAINKTLRLPLKGKKVLLLGAGGAARAILLQLILSGCKKIFVSNRTRKKMMKMLKDISSLSDNARLVPLTNPYPCPEGTDLIINATSQGLRAADSMPYRVKSIPRNTRVMDIVYQPGKKTTRWVHACLKENIRAVDGVDMLLYQGMESFAFWFPGETPGVAAMRRSILSALNRK